MSDSSRTHQNVWVSSLLLEFLSSPCSRHDLTATCRSMREALKALNTIFAAASVPHALPDELLATIENFLERYDDIDDHDAQRFHDELHALYLRHVASQPDKLGAFLSALRLLRPVITGETRLATWWELVLRPTIDGVGHKRHDIEEAREFVLSILVYDRDTDDDGQHARISVLFTNKLLELYLARANSLLTMEPSLSPDNEFVLHELESLLVAFGRKMPKVGRNFPHLVIELTLTSVGSDLGP